MTQRIFQRQMNQIFVTDQMASNTLPRVCIIILSPLALLKLYRLFDDGRMRWSKKNPGVRTENFRIDGLTMLERDLKSMKMTEIWRDAREPGYRDAGGKSINNATELWICPDKSK
mmetsp:Transcript_15284/g.22754  ORF Transcript_15284/g.22754 Transcript_15284/m.22754 type:complete len:115 (+) Transcript_15284:31-375(+)